MHCLTLAYCVYVYAAHFYSTVTRMFLRLRMEHFQFTSTSELPKLLAQCISTKRLQLRGGNCLRVPSLSTQ